MQILADTFSLKKTSRQELINLIIINYKSIFKTQSRVGSSSGVTQMEIRPSIDFQCQRPCIQEPHHHFMSVEVFTSVFCLNIHVEVTLRRCVRGLMAVRMIQQ